MHKLKRAARNHAWYADKGETTYNPFGRVWSGPGSRNGPYDEEADAASMVSDSAVLSPGDRDRYDTLQAHPPHAKSFPRASKDETRSNDISPVSPTLKRELGNSTDSELPVKHPEREPTFIESANEAAQEKRGVRQRMMARLGRGKKGQSSEGVEHVESTLSTKREKQTFTILGQLRAIFLSSWVNLMLVFIPVAFVVHFTHASATLIFVMSFLAIIPLAALLSFATEEVALYVGETLGGLLNATFGNAVELIVSIIALFKNEIIVVQASLIGSMLSNLLLVLGMCFFFGGIHRETQSFNPMVANASCSLLAISIGTLLIPTAFHSFSGRGTEGITETSRGVAIILLFVYGCYLLFQLKSHAHIYQAESPKSEKKRKEKGATQKGLASVGNMAANTTAKSAGKEIHKPSKDDEPEIPQLSVIAALLTLVGSTVLVAFCSDYLVGSISELTKTTGVSTNFIALIVVPIVGNAAEHATAVTVAIKDKMDLAIGVAVGSSLQIALLLFPVIIVIGWIGGKHDMNLDLDGFQVIVLVVAIWLVNYIIQDGKSHWLEGILLMSLYVVVSVAAWFYPKEIPLE
ncbi:MAG: hypothetical protein M1814_000779 [Vezdaea aestivalis]|nr:MAG: hypothetical protein M1814_000779 [Vezdaea aestivalis]